MVLAVTHSLISAFYVFLVKKWFNLRFINNNHLFVAAVAGILPDLDIIIRCFNNLLNLNLPEILGHRGLFHTPFFALLFLIPGIILLFTKKREYSTYLFIIAWGIILHICLDYLTSGGIHKGIMWFFPIDNTIYSGILGEKDWIVGFTMDIDAILLILWLFWLVKKEKIKEFF